MRLRDRRILRDQTEALDGRASTHALDQSIKHTVTFLRTEAASIEIQPVSFADSQMKIPVLVRNLSGHKLPTAYPSRRAWILLEVTHVEGQTIFSSGQYNADGELIDITGKVLASEPAGGPVNEHKSLITRSDQVQVYETIMGDAEGKPTFTLLRGATYVKDNRLLPLGWNRSHADGPATRPYGIGGDPDFVDGHDLLTYQIPTPPPGEYTITAKLLFQVIAPRHANELFQFQTPEVQQFQIMYDNANRNPDILAASTQKVSKAMEALFGKKEF